MKNIKFLKLLGKGSYAKVYHKNSYSVIKITTDEATKKLLTDLYKTKTKGFVKVLNITAEHFVLERLYPLDKQEKKKIKYIYNLAVENAIKKLKNKDNLNAAQLKKERLNFVYKNKTKMLSQQIVLEFKDLCQKNENGKDLKIAFSFLKKFIEKHNFDIDLINYDNWMKNKDNQIILSDPVVKNAYKF